MRLNIRLFALITAIISQPSTAQEEIFQVQSQYDVRTTANRLIAAVRVQGLNVISRTDHGEKMQEKGKDFHFAEMVIFDYPKQGTPLISCSQTAKIELPHKALIWEDSERNVWLAYNNPADVAERHRLDKCDFEIKKVEKTLASLATLATQPTPQQ
ncbi:DUF302 domain-containing protein [Grimontia hollisae]|uniref:DUF302 domain-containing protein n=1 Tax=Grimontia hollisae TaxID=673 RepID=UPI000E05ADD2|nr:DUF302 domain-containing protein [Grimontia hollisae]STQ75679.1 camphor resistance protein CrcB [Grimontia hollisae]